MTLLPNVNPRQVVALLTSGVQAEVMSTGALPQAVLAQAGVGAIGTVTTWATAVGTSLGQEQGATVWDVFKRLQQMQSIGGGQSGLALVGVVTSAIRSLVSGITKAGERTFANYSAARVQLLATPRTYLTMQDLPPIGLKMNGEPVEGQTRGTYLFVRPLNTADRWVPYVDDVSCYVPRPFIPKDFPTINGEPACWALPDVCTDDVAILGDTGKQDCHNVEHENQETVNWAYAWPLTSPSRLGGLLSRHGDLAAEKIAAGLYLLPTPQHVATQLRHVLECERLLKIAAAVYFPDAREVAPGIWARENPVPEIRTEPFPPFDSLAMALRRVHDFQVVRAILAAGKRYWPIELHMSANLEDFA